MKKILGLFLLTTAFQAQSSTQYIVNGGFETGDFTGWTVTNTIIGLGSGGWNINDGTFDPEGDQTPQAPISGVFDAVTSQSASGFHSLFQTFTLDAAFDSAIFSWSDRIYNNFDEFSNPDQQWRALIKNSTGGLISTVFSTNPGDLPIQNGPNNRSFDLTALLQGYAGQAVSIGFEEQDNILRFSATLDNVSFTTSQNPIPEPAGIALLGLGLLGMQFARRKTV